MCILIFKKCFKSVKQGFFFKLMLHLVFKLSNILSFQHSIITVAYPWCELYHVHPLLFLVYY